VTPDASSRDETPYAVFVVFVVFVVFGILPRRGRGEKKTSVFGSDRRDRASVCSACAYVVLS